jgi:type IV pilus assembly protein PilO
MDFSELQEIDIADLTTWPIWFRWIAVAVLGAGILYAGYRYFVEPEQKILAKLESAEKQLKATFLTKKELVVNLPAYRLQMEEIQDRFGVVLRQLPDKTEVPALLIDISQVGLARGLQFQQFKPSSTRAEEFYIILPISIQVSGTYHQLAEFISDLAALPRIVTLGNMGIRRQKGTTLSMTAQLYTYQYLEESLDVPNDQTIRAQG